MKKVKNKAAQALAAKRHKSLSPERRTEIARAAGRKSGEIRRKKADVDKGLQ